MTESDALTDPQRAELRCVQDGHRLELEQRRLDLELQQMLAAIKRLDRQRYGVCLRCQEPISYECLLIRPTTPRCYGCQGDVESRKYS
ncbi:MAG: TraR/DksA C4-type zinc finger protein [Nitrospira sp.]|nr:TraR/DksA C4-type zinc finger protein [Nitrospira sp.]